MEEKISVGVGLVRLTTCLISVPQLGIFVAAVRSHLNWGPMPAPNRSRVGAVQHPPQDFLRCFFLFASVRNHLI